MVKSQKVMMLELAGYNQQSVLKLLQLFADITDARIKSNFWPRFLLHSDKRLAVAHAVGVRGFLDTNAVN